MKQDIWHFNSIKVRLEHIKTFTACRIHLFQFHKGAIRTHINDRGVMIDQIYFNSIKVRLEQKDVLDKAKADLDFNSIKVRLERSFLSVRLLINFYFNSIKVRLERNLSRRHPIRLLFQFHKGAIRTRSVRDYLMCYHNFNSIKVRLEQYL